MSPQDIEKVTTTIDRIEQLCRDMRANMDDSDCLASCLNEIRDVASETDW